MKPHIAFAIGIAVGLLVTSTVLVFRESQARSRVEIEIGTLKQALASANETAQRGQDALRSARQELQALRDRETMQPQKQGAAAMALPPSISPANSAILGYLGDSVPPPQNFDPKYSAEALASTFKALCERRGVKIEKLGVDTSEFPFVVHGVVENGRELFQKIGDELRAIPGYSYGGSVTGRTSSDATFFSLSMTPSRALPRENQEAVSRRLMLRLQMIAAAWRDPEP